jgi:glycerophosphoryl diester phosphodiesterase
MFEVQGHRGAKGLAPENTLAGFEIALDCGVASIETDVHLTGDDLPVLVHDPRLGPDGPLVRELTLAQLRTFRVPGPAHRPTPLAECFAQECGGDVHGIPTLAEFFDFAAAHTPTAEKLIFDLELKRIPFHPETIGDDYSGTGPAALERLVVAAIRQAGVEARTRVRSFDHRCVRAAQQLAPALQTALLAYHTVPTDLRSLLGDADVYCPDYRFVDAEVVRQVHAAGKRIIPYTVNEPHDWQRLIAWGVDGITTDYPDRLLAALPPNI